MSKLDLSNIGSAGTQALRRLLNGLEADKPVEGDPSSRMYSVRHDYDLLRDRGIIEFYNSPKGRKSFMRLTPQAAAEIAQIRAHVAAADQKIKESQAATLQRETVYHLAEKLQPFISAEDAELTDAELFQAVADRLRNGIRVNR